jgi:hypothetical protein
MFFRFSAALVLIATLVACGESDPPQEPAWNALPPPETETSEAANQWGELTRAETLILELDQSLRELAFALRNLELPDARTRPLFAPVGLRIEDLGSLPEAPDLTLDRIGARVFVAPPAPVESDRIPIGLQLWKPLLDQVERVDYAKLQIRRGGFVPGRGEREDFEGELVFSAHARLRSGEFIALSAAPRVRWARIGGSNELERESWRISEWHTGTMKWTAVADPLFRETLAEALPQRDVLERARASIHERLVAKDTLSRLGRGEFEPPHEFFAHTAVSQHPSISVVDIDGDGFDDFYVTTRLDRNRLFRNRGDGTFEEIAGKLGIDVDSHTNAALFADFDNDGDPDLFLGRSIEPSVYLVNEDGRFVDRTDKIDGRVPQLVSSVSAADVDGDGLLDLYLSTYAVQLPLEAIRERIDPIDYQRFTSRVKGANPFLEVPGPPNQLLRNTGSGFVIDRTEGAHSRLRNTYQATWSDYDADGDPDLYLANDFARDDLLRNDDGVLTDVTEELGFELVGFGMGATWGDFDRDQRQDLYVANMFSKAGNRVTEALGYLDPRFRQAAQGNFLYRNGNEGFELVSGGGEGRLPVNQAGWAWGTHFFDADNDGFLDLFALAGFHTAPREVEKVGDT